MVSTLQTEHLKENVGDAIVLVTQQEIVENLKITREKCCKIGHFPACCHTRQSQGGATVGGKPHRGRGGMDRNSGRGRGKQNVRSEQSHNTGASTHPTVEETVQEMGEMKVFTKLDLNISFHQVELHPESRDITTFAAPNGLYRYKRLVFGLNMASEKCNHIIRQVVQDCPGTSTTISSLEMRMTTNMTSEC